MLATITMVLKKEENTKVATRSHRLIARYVSDIARIWRSADLNPKRAIGSLNLEYRGKFHRFANLF